MPLHLTAVHGDPEQAKQLTTWRSACWVFRVSEIGVGSVQSSMNTENTRSETLPVAGSKSCTDKQSSFTNTYKGVTPQALDGLPQEEADKVCPEATSGLWSLTTFSWISPLLRTGYKYAWLSARFPCSLLETPGPPSESSAPAA